MNEEPISYEQLLANNKSLRQEVTKLGNMLSQCEKEKGEAKRRYELSQKLQWEAEQRYKKLKDEKKAENREADAPRKKSGGFTSMLREWNAQNDLSKPKTEEESS